WFLGGRCVVCGAAGPSLCPDCRWQLPAADEVPAPAPLADITALVRYEARGRDLVRALKYHNRRSVVGELGQAMARAAPGDHDVVTWLPTTGRRRRQRGFDQARLLAVAVARASGRPGRPLLRRVDAQAQTGRSRRDRLGGPTLHVAGPAEGVVVLVDDVVTTGASLRAGARALTEAGAVRVHGLALAQTPRLVRSPSEVGRR
ncbi:MAG: hypothetical protein OES57_14655, partial [Acidimicrobiia bacterium]|nr:hypothetical protein [Acidimicrobiia bacterium]